MFKTILLAVDGSKHAKNAAGVAAELAAKYKAALVVVSVSPLSITADEIERSGWYRRLGKPAKDEIKRVRDALDYPGEKPFTGIPAPSRALVALAEAIIADAETVIRKRQARNVRRAPLIGEPAQAILDEAKRSKADLIVMGTRGLSDLSGLVMGSVSHKIMHMASCPCVTVK